MTLVLLPDEGEALEVVTQVQALPMALLLSLLDLVGTVVLTAAKVTNTGLEQANKLQLFP
jgi:hypothetical protein